ncbi:SpoIIE family protein phosphatase [Kineococcus sp. LSe6-4]|uniref:SpoIIE family protein phosphatase n=1 Tax=Kineococcus halophytocola TaxID=3234027 RepID=A0ABV4H136_9ACTN
MDDAAADGRVPAPTVTGGPSLPRPARPPRDDAHRAADQLTADAARTSSARRLQTATTRPDLDGLATVAARLLGAASGRITLLADGPVVVGSHGPQPAAEAGAPGAALARTVCAQTAAAGRPLAIGDTRTDLRVAELPVVRAGDVGSYLGVPLATRDGRVVGAVCVFDREPRHWEPGAADLLQHVAGAATAELELAAAGEARAGATVAETAVESAGVGTFVLQVATGRVDWDDRTLALFGLRREELNDDVEVAFERIHPEDRVAARADLAVALATGGYTSSYRVLLPDGTVRWMEARGSVLDGGRPATERLVGTVLDVTAHHRVTGRIAQALEGMAVGYLAVDRGWRVAHANAAAERLCGTGRADLLGRSVVDLLGAGATDELTDLLRRALRTGEAVVELARPGSAPRWVEVRAVPEGEGLAVYLLETTARREAARATERASTRACLLAEVTAVFTGEADPDVAAQRFAELVVPALGDWCVVTLVDDDSPVNTPVRAVPRPADLRRGLRDVGHWHRDPARRPLVARYAEHRLADLTRHAFLWRALREGRPLRIPDATTAVSAVLAEDGTARRLLHELAPSCGLVLPLPGRGRTTGLLTVFQDAGRPPLDAEDVGTVVELAGRAGLALDSARLHRHQRRFAEELQRSLLTDPPAPAHADLAVRYVPSARTAQVGGDWYDAFEQPTGTVLVIGDVVGHDTRAATAMAQVRTVVRTLGAVGDDRPADVLARSDRVVASSQPDLTASALAVRLEDVPGEGTGTRLRWSSAGHPPAVVLGPEGTVDFLTAGEADLLLGVDPAAPRHDHVVDLPAGSTVLLYTDGLVERRDASLDEGFQALAQALADVHAQAPADLDALVDALLARTLPAEAADDVALLAVRLHPRA